MTLTLIPINTPDALGVSKPLISYNDGTNNATAHVLLDSTGALLSPATSALQTAGNASAATTAANTANIPAKGAALAANSLPVTLASDQTLPLPAGASTAALQAAANASLTTIAAGTPALGQTLAAGSVPVVLTAAQVTALSAPVLAAGTAVVGKLGIDQTTPGTSNGVQVNAALPTGANVIGAVTANAGTNLNTSALALDASVNGIIVAQGSTTSGQKGTLIQGAVSASAPALTTGQSNPLSLDTAGNLRVNVVAGGAAGGGTSSGFAAAFPATGTALGAKNGANMVNLTADASGNLNVNLQAALPAGTAIVGKFTTDQTAHGTTDLMAADITKVGGTALAIGQQLSAASIPVVLPAAQITSLTPPTTVAVTQATGANLHAVIDSGTLTSITNALPAGANTIGSVGLAAGSAKVGQVAIDQTTPGVTNLVQLPAAQITALTPPTTVTANAGTGTMAVSAAALPLPAGASTAANQTSVIGSATGGAAATSSQLSGGVFNTAAPTLTTGQQAALQTDASANLKVNVAAALPIGTNSIGNLGTVAAVTAITNALPAGANLLGKVTTNDGTNSITIKAASTAAVATDTAQVVALSPNTPLPAGANVLGGVNVADGSDVTVGAKADASATTDTGTFSLIALFKRSLQSLTSILAACQAATPIGANVIGKVGIDQTTPGTTNLVQIGGSLPAGSAVIGSVTVNGGTVHLTAALTVTAGAYTTGMVVGGLITLTGAARVNAGSGIVQSFTVNVATALTAPYDVLLFDTIPSATFTDNAVLPSLTQADRAALCGVAHCNDLISLGTPQLLQALNLAIPFKLSAANTSLYAVTVMRGSQTFAATTAVGVSAILLQD